MSVKAFLFVMITMVALVGGATRPVVAATVVSDAKRGIAFTLPDGYLENPGGTRSPKLNLAFNRSTPDHPGRSILQVVSLKGTIGPGKLDPAVVEKAARDSVRGTGVELGTFEFRKAMWKGFSIDLVTNHAKNGDQAIFSLTAQVPLAGEAIELALAGPAEDEPTLLADFQAVLASLQGKSSWLSDAERSERLGKIIGTLVGFVVGLPLLIVLLRRKRRPRE